MRKSKLNFVTPYLLGCTVFIMTNYNMSNEHNALKNIIENIQAVV